MNMRTSFNEFDLNGKVAVVTGVGRGIGSHIALSLAKYDADLVLCSRTYSELGNIVQETRMFGGNVLLNQADLTIVSDTNKMVEEAQKTYGHLDIPVNNAGINIPQKAEEVTEEAWDTTILIPTTAGTGAEVTPNAILTDVEENLKKAMYCKPLYSSLDDHR